MAAKIPPKDSSTQNTIFNYKETYQTTTKWGTKKVYIFSGNEKHHSVLIKSRDIFQRFLAWCGLGSKDFFSNKTLVLNEDIKSTNRTEVQERGKQHVATILKGVPKTTIVKIQTKIETQLIHTEGEREKAAITDSAQRAVEEAQQRSEAATLAKANLLEKGRKSGIDNFDVHGRTALYYAVNVVDVNKVKALIEGGANPDLPSYTSDKKTPKELVKDMMSEIFSSKSIPDSSFSIEGMEKLSKISNLLGF